MKKIILAAIFISLSSGVFALDINNAQSIKKTIPASSQVGEVSGSSMVDKVEQISGRRYHGTCHILNDRGQSIDSADCTESHVTCRSGWGTQCSIGDKQGVLRNNKIERADTLDEKVENQ